MVPRRRLPEVLRQVYEIVERHQLLVMNVFHAGDGNLHPLLVFDKREPGVMDRVHAAGEEIVRVSVAAGGVLSGEHGIGLEKRDFMPLMFSESTSMRRLACGGRSTRPGWPTPTRCCRQRRRAPICNTCRRVRGSDGVCRRCRHNRTGDDHRARNARRPGARRAHGAPTVGHRVDTGRRDDDALWCRDARRRRRCRAGGSPTVCCAASGRNGWRRAVGRAQRSFVDWATDLCATCCCRLATSPIAVRSFRRAGRR